MSVVRHVTAAMLSAPLAVQAQEAANGGGSGVDLTSLTRLTLGLVAVVAAIVLLGWLLRRMGAVGGGAGGQVRVVGGVSVGNRERILLVQAGKTQLLVGVAPGRVQTLHVLDEPIETPETGTGTSGQAGPFAARLRQVMQRDGKRHGMDNN